MRAMLLAFLISVASLTTATRADHLHSGLRKRSVSHTSSASFQDSNYWMETGMDEVQKALEVDSKRNNGVAKNIVVFVGDGMSAPTVTAARIYKAQTVNNNFETPESEQLVFESLHHVGLSKTYCVDYQTPDSAATATALFSGIKTRMSALGFDESIDPYDITSALNATKVTTVLKWAQEAEKRTGIVTTTRITHATPGALYAHVHNRDFECDTALRSKDSQDQEGEEEEEEETTVPDGLHDIAWQLIKQEPGSLVNVVLGGGKPAFMLKMNETESEWTECQGREDEDLIQTFLDDHDKSTFVDKESDLVNVNTSEIEYLFGLFGDSHVAYDDERVPGQDPSLANMTVKALEILAESDKGFFLMVESGRIDHAHHDTTAVRALHETVALDLAVEQTLAFLEDIGEIDDTLIIVTADHAHTMSISGYAQRGVDIRGLSTWPYEDELPYTTLSYANGQGFEIHNILNDEGNGVTRKNLTGDPDVKDFDFIQTSSGPLYSETHGGDDVIIFAQGPMAHLFHGVHEQTHVAHVMAYSACIGHFQGKDKRCMNHKNENDSGIMNSPQIFLGILASTTLLLIR